MTSKLYISAGALDQFRFYLIAENVKKATITNYVSDLRHFFQFFNYFQSKKSELSSENSRKTDEHLTTSMFPLLSNVIEEYKKHLTLTFKSYQTRRRRIITLKKFLEFLKTENVIEEREKIDLTNILKKDA